MLAPRRRFLCAAGAALTSSLFFRPDGWALAAEQGLAAARREGHALGSSAAITALHADQTVAQAAVDDAFAALETVEEVMSIYRAESQISRLNRDGVLHRPHADLVTVLKTAVEMSRRTDGAFDITVQPLWSLFSAARKEGGSPTAEQIASARRLIDWRRIEIEDDVIRLRGEGVQITLNGIAQGFAADKASAAIAARGVRHALIDTGEIGALGNNANEQAPWKVGIQHPRVPEAYISLAKLAGRRLATSGDYATTFSDDFSSHHLFDPRTGKSARELASVSIAADSAMQADALSTAVFVLGAEEGSRLVKNTPGADALLVLKSGRVLKSAGFPV